MTVISGSFWSISVVKADLGQFSSYLFACVEFEARYSGLLTLTLT